MEERQVGGEEDAGHEGQGSLTARARTLAALLPPGQQEQRRDGERRSIRGRRRRRDGRQDDDDAAEGDAQRTGHDGQREGTLATARARPALGVHGPVGGADQSRPRIRRMK